MNLKNYIVNMVVKILPLLVLANSFFCVSVCAQEVIDFGRSEIFVGNNKRFLNDYFTINLKKCSSLGAALEGFQNKTLHIQVGSFEMNIPGSKCFKIWECYHYIDFQMIGAKQHHIFCPYTNRIILHTKGIPLEGITNPITVNIKFSDGWELANTSEWSANNYFRGVRYTTN